MLLASLNFCIEGKIKIRRFEKPCTSSRIFLQYCDMIKNSELILNPDGSVYHLNLKPGDVSDTIITVGDPERIRMFDKHFEKITKRVHNREFFTQTGICRGKSISIISTGIGTDNIDIVLNEIDALFNIDLQTREIKEDKEQLNFIRIGTSGAIVPQIKVDTLISSAYCVGFDSLLHFYKSKQIRIDQLEKLVEDQTGIKQCYAVKADTHLLKTFDEITSQGITLTAPGFYAPQSRKLRLDYHTDLISILGSQEFNGLGFTNLEMESAGIYGLSALLGHKAISLNAILANRANGEFSKNPGETVQKLIDDAMDILCQGS